MVEELTSYDYLIEAKYRNIQDVAVASTSKRVTGRKREIGQDEEYLNLNFSAKRVIRQKNEIGLL